MYKFMLSNMYFLSQETYRILKILPRHRTVRFRKLASKGHNHQQETYSRPILHRGFNFYFHVQNQNLKYQIPPISFSIG